MAGTLLQAGGHDWLSAHGAIILGVIVLFPLVFLFRKLPFAGFDAREPTVVKSRLPLIGHMISLARERTGFYRRLYKETRLPICTLPILNGKLCVVNSPDLIAAAMKNQDLSFTSLSISFAKNMDGFLDAGYDAIHTSLAGNNLKNLIATGLAALATSLNKIEPNAALDISNSYDWIEELVFPIFMNTLYGEKNPVTSKEIRTFQDFEKSFVILGLNFAPNIIARASVAARDRLQSVVAPYYQAQDYDRADVSAFIREHARFLRRYGFSNEEIGHMDFILAFAAITSSIPTSFWMFVYIFSQPEWVSRLRQEIEAVAVITDNGTEGRMATLSSSKLQTECPVLTAFWHETTRVCVDNIGNRVAMRDTMLRDPYSGAEYLVTKGTNVQWASSVTQLDEAVWGPNANTFEPTKWLNMSIKNQACRKTMVPFGGGKVLCPGKLFAETEITSFISGIVLSFDASGVQVPESKNPTPGVPVKSPAWGGTSAAFKMKRRPGWEDVKLQFAP